MAIAALTAWLNDPNRIYIQGKYLYEQYGSNRSLLAFFNTGSTSFHLTKLTSAISALNQDSNIEPKPLKVPDIIPPSDTPERVKISYDSAPDQILLILEKKRLNYAKARKLFEMIRVMENDEQRLEAGLEILALMDEVNEAWAIIDEWNETGRIREIKEKESMAEVQNMSIPQLFQEKARLAPNISKDRKKFNNAKTDRERLKYSKKLEANELRYKLVQERIATGAV